MSKTSPYFSMNGLAFQTSGDTLECELNFKATMQKLEAYVLSRGSQDEAMTALAFLEDMYPSIEQFCDDIRITFILDDYSDSELKARVSRRAYNRIVDRLNGQPLR